MNKIKLRMNRLVLSKVRYLMSQIDTECWGVGIGAKENPLDITDIKFPKQVATAATVEVDDEDYGKLIFDLQSAGYEPRQMFTYIHTHPWTGTPSPSGTDWTEFARYHKAQQFGIMIIVSKDSMSVYLTSHIFGEGYFPLDVELYDVIDGEVVKELKEAKDRISKNYPVVTPSPVYPYAAQWKDYKDYSDYDEWEKPPKNTKKGNVKDDLNETALENDARFFQCSHCANYGYVLEAEECPLCGEEICIDCANLAHQDEDFFLNNICPYTTTLTEEERKEAVNESNGAL